MATGLPPKPRRVKGVPLITRRELAARLGCHMQTITKHEREGLPIAERGRKGKASRYREVDVRAWLAMREAAATAVGYLDMMQERARKERAQAILAEQTFSMRARELLPREEVERIWGAEVAAVRAKLLAWPTTLADRVHRAALVEGVDGVERAVRAAVTDALTELAAPDRPAGAVT